jgi:hypothetical protein
MLWADLRRIKSQALENRCFSCSFYFGIKIVRLEDDEHGYPRMNTDIEGCFAERILTSVSSLLLSVFIRVPLALSNAGIDSAEIEEPLR